LPPKDVEAKLAIEPLRLAAAIAAVEAPAPAPAPKLLVAGEFIYILSSAIDSDSEGEVSN
jgi:hypothetical protein